MITCSVRAKLSISTKKNFGAVYEISFNASISRNFPGPFQTSLTESPSPQKNVYRRCFRRLVWKLRVLSRQVSGEEEAARIWLGQVRVSSSLHRIHTSPPPACLPFLLCEDFSSPQIVISHRVGYDQD